MSTHKRLIRAARKAKAQRLARWNGVPTPASHFATQGVTPAVSGWGRLRVREVSERSPIPSGFGMPS